jgi:hypothetical protein
VRGEPNRLDLIDWFIATGMLEIPEWLKIRRIPT